MKGSTTEKVLYELLYSSNIGDNGFQLDLLRSAMPGKLLHW